MEGGYLYATLAILFAALMVRRTSHLKKGGVRGENFMSCWKIGRDLFDVQGFEKLGRIHSVEM